MADGDFYRYAYNNPNVFADPSGNWPTVPPSLSAWGKATLDAGEMTLQFALGTGPQSRNFGPDSVEVQNMKNSPGVDKARDYYRKNGCDKNGAPRSVNGGHPFGLKGLVQSGFNPTQQFVGSYDWIISPNANGTVTFTLTNETSMTSLAYHLLPSWDRHALGPKISLPFGNVTQTFSWTEPNPAACGCH